MAVDIMVVMGMAVDIMEAMDMVVDIMVVMENKVKRMANILYDIINALQ